MRFKNEGKLITQEVSRYKKKLETEAETFPFPEADKRIKGQAIRFESRHKSGVEWRVFHGRLSNIEEDVGRDMIRGEKLRQDR